MPAIDQTLYLALEGTPGTEAAVVGGDAMDYHECSFRAEGRGKLERSLVRQHGDRLPAKRPHGKFWSIDLSTEIKAAAAAGAEPEIARILRGSGFKGTEDVGVSWTYAPHDRPNTLANRQSLTAVKEMSAEGVKVTGFGARFGQLVFESDFEGQLNLSAQGVAAYKTPVDQGAALIPSFNAGTPLVVLDSAAPIALQNGYVPVLRRVRFEVPIVARARGDMAAGAVGPGTSHYHRWPAFLEWPADQPVGGELEIELENETAHDIWARYELATVDTVDRSIKWAAGSRALEARFASLQYGTPQMVSGFPVTYRLPFSAYRDGTVESLSLVFT